jgi:hypothetical protein
MTRASTGRYGGRDRQISLLQVIDRTQAKRLLALGSKKFGVDFHKFSAKGRRCLIDIRSACRP